MSIVGIWVWGGAQPGLRVRGGAARVGGAQPGLRMWAGLNPGLFHCYLKVLNLLFFFVRIR